MNDIFRFASTRWGRCLRFVAGMIIGAYGLGVGHFTGAFFAGWGFLILASAGLDLMVTAPFFNLPITGIQIRKRFNIREPELTLD